MTSLPPAAGPGRSLISWAAAAFPVTLWLVGCCFFGGHLGKWTDDYGVAGRDPVSGLSRPVHWQYPRPLGNSFATLKGALLWEHDRANHLISAGLHALAALLLWRLLRQFTRSPLPAALGAMAFMVCPLHYEIIFWPSAAHAGLATVTFLALALVYLRFACRRGGWPLVPLMIVLAYLIPCWWEQPAAGIPALPLLYFAVRRPGRISQHEIARTLLPALGCLIAVVVYVAQVRSLVPATQRGGRDSLIAIHELGPRVADLWAQIQHQVLGRGMISFVHGAATHGLTNMAGVRGAVLGAVLLIAAGFWWVRVRRETRLVVGVPPPTAPLSGLLGLAASLTIFTLAWLPIVVIRGQGMAMRMQYFPLVGLTLTGTLLVDWFYVELRGRRRGTIAVQATMGMFAGLLVLGAVSQVGAQAALRTRYAMDQAELAQLRDLVPAPPPGAVFVPLYTAAYPAHTGSHEFDAFAAGALATEWSALNAVQQTYARTDVFASYCLPSKALPLSDFAAAAPCYASEQILPYEPCARGHRIPRDRMIPLLIDTDDSVQLVDRIVVERPDQSTFEIRFPHVQALLETRGLPPRTGFVQDGEPLRELKPLSEWRWTATDKRVEFREQCHWGAGNEAVTMVAGQGNDRRRAEMVTTLEPDAKPVRLLFRATLSQNDVRYVENGGARLVWYLQGQRHSPLATVDLTARDARAQHRWLPVTVTAPAHTAPKQLRISVETLAGANSLAARVNQGCAQRNSPQ